MEQSFRQEEKREPNVMHENLKILKQTQSPLKKLGQTQKFLTYDKISPRQIISQKPSNANYNQFNQSESSIKKEIESSQALTNNNQKLLLLDQINNEDLRHIKNKESNVSESIERNFNNIQRHIHQSILDEFQNESLQDFEKELLEQLKQGEHEMQNANKSQVNQKKLLEKQFTKALKRYVKQEIHNAFLSTQKVKNVKTLADEEEQSKDSIFQLLNQPTEKQQLSFSKDYQQQENSMEEEILKEISHNLANKMDGLKNLFTNLETKLSKLEQKSKPQYQYQTINNVQFFTTSTDQHVFDYQVVEEDSQEQLRVQEHNQSQNKVNAEDLDFWVKKADEYKELYMRAELRNQMLQEQYEQKFQELQNSYDLRFQELKLASSLELYSSKQNQANTPLHQTPNVRSNLKCRNCENFIQLAKITDSNQDMDLLKNKPGNYKCLEKLIDAIQKKNNQIKKLNDSYSELENKLQESYQVLQRVSDSPGGSAQKDKHISQLKQEIEFINEEKETLKLEIRHMKLKLKKYEQQ